MLQASHSGAADGVGQLKTGEVCVGANNDGIKSNLILETINVVGGVGVNVLEGLCELVIQAVDKSDDRSLNEHGFAVLRGAILVSLIHLGNVLLDNVEWVGLQGGQKDVQELLSAKKKK